MCIKLWGADRSVARPGKKQAWKHVGDVCDFNNIEVRAVIKSPPPSLQGKVSKEIHAILGETSACFLPGWAKDLPPPPLCYRILPMYKVNVYAGIS